jgi:hypothetical protein
MKQKCFLLQTFAARSKTFSGLGGSLAVFGVSESPKMMFTRQYSISAMNTNLLYETNNREWLEFDATKDPK